MRFDLTTFKLVLAIAQTRHSRRAAKREHLALPTASKRLSDLETRRGVRLFERRARRVAPPEPELALVRHVRTLNASLHALESDIVEFSRGIKGPLRIAANASAMAEWLPTDPLDRAASVPDSSPLPTPAGVARQSRISPKARP